MKEKRPVNELQLNLKVRLAGRGNPDLRQDPDRPPYDCEPDRFEPVDDFYEAAIKCVEFIRRNDLGGGNWSGGQIFDTHTNQVVGRVTYNGKLFLKVVANN